MDENKPNPFSGNSFPSNRDLLNYDICMLFGETRAHVRLLSKMMAQKSKNKISEVYYNSFYLMIQLFDVSSMAIEKSKMIEDWKEHEKTLRDFFSKVEEGLYSPKKIIKAWELLSRDISLAGIYDEPEDFKKERIRREMLLNVI